MNNQLQEKRTHGTPLFQFQIYNIHNTEPFIHVGLHWHREMEMLHILSGTVYVTIGNVEYKGKAGDVFFVNTGELHAVSMRDGASIHNAFLFPLDFISFESYDLCQSRYIHPLYTGEAAFLNYMPPDHRGAIAVKECLDRIATHCAREEMGYQLAVKGELLFLFSMLVKNEVWCEKNPARPDMQKLEAKKRILEYINENCHEHLTLREVAERFGYSQKYFCSFFKNNFGRTFVDYLNQVRLEKAAALLNDSDRKVMDIALSVGFENFSYFIRKFREYSGGLTPSQFRKSYDSSIQHDHMTRWRTSWITNEGDGQGHFVERDPNGTLRWTDKVIAGEATPPGAPPGNNHPPT